MKNDFLQQVLCSSVLAIALVATPAFATTVTYSTDFEAPTFAPGAVLTQDPRYYTGQGGWGGYNSGAISTNYAHSGTQSLATTGVLHGSGPQHVLDASSPSFWTPNAFTFGTDFWMQTWVRVTAGGHGAEMTFTNGLGSCPLISISGTGVPEVTTCQGGAGSVHTGTSLGSNALDQWLLLRIRHTTSMASDIEYSIFGNNVNYIGIFSPSYGPGTGNPGLVTLTGDAYWDDFSAGYGDAPPPVPLPASAWLMLSGLGGLGVLGRKRKS